MIWDTAVGLVELADVNLDPFNLEVDYKIWFEKVADGGSQSLIGEKKIELLMAIHKFGSIKTAAEKCKLDFKVAWDMINSANERFKPHDLVISTRGRGGGSYLSPLGLEILQQYEKMNSIIKSILPKILGGHVAKIIKTSTVSKNILSMNLQIDPTKTGTDNLDEIMNNYKKVFVIPIDDDEKM